MMCPNCFSIMYNNTEIIDVGNDTQLMDLHCYNENCSSKSVNYQPHLSVLVRQNETWKCNSYHLPLQYKDNWYALETTSSFIRKSTKIFKLAKDQIGWSPVHGGGAINKRGLLLIEKSLVDIEFVPISTGDDMPLEANKLFKRLMGLVVFS